jgi:hypothetical protein
MLIANGADLTVQDEALLGVCHWAAHQEAHKILKKLLEAGARWVQRSHGVVGWGDGRIGALDDALIHHACCWLEARIRV